MNAGGVPNTCKSNEFRHLQRMLASEENVETSGGRVSNTWVTDPKVGDNIWKQMLIPHNNQNRMVLI